MTKMKRLAIWLVLVPAISLPVGIWLYWEIQIDKCLDAGRAWNYERRHCVFEVSQK